MNGTDNSYFEQKVLLRLEALTHSKNDNILDCYAGKGKLWAEVERRCGRKLNITAIEKEKGKNPLALCGDNLKIMKSLDLEKYGLVDLDAYGHPSDQLAYLSEKKYKGVVCVTWIDTMFNKQPRIVAEAAGINGDFYCKHFVIFNSLNDRLLENFLYLCRVKKYKGYFFGPKKYFYFNQ